ncbi:MAG: ankyrin repeat domain-containing protein [Parachlamydiaceae bacterium]|nr:ankyrin repeat domain-containing protein [Parachlamydiaceae bacterium]
MSSLDSITRSISQSEFLINVDKICDYLPFVSTITNLAVILKKIEMDCSGTPLTEDQHYYLHIQKKDYVDCVVLLIPVIGNIAYSRLFSCCFPHPANSEVIQIIQDLQIKSAKRDLEFTKTQIASTLKIIAQSATLLSGKEVKPEELKLAEGKNKELSQAIKSKDTESVKLLLEDSVDPNFEELGRSQFIHACEVGALEICKLMLPKIEDINALDKFGDTCLIQACKSGNEEVAKFLLENGADPSINTPVGGKVLFAAVQGKNIKIFDLLLDFNGENTEKVIVELRDHNQNTLLNHSLDDIHMTTAILERVIDLKEEFINTQGNFGFTVLHNALRNDKFDVAEFLLESGADPFISTVDEDLIVTDRSSFSGMSFIDGGITPFIIACEKGQLSFVQEVINKLADVQEEERKKLLNMQTKSGATALSKALENPYSEEVQKTKLTIADLLLDAGADPLMITEKTLTPLMTACEEGYTDLVLKICEANALDQDTEQKLLESCAHKSHLELLYNLLGMTSLANRNPCFNEILNTICGTVKPEFFDLRSKIVNMLLEKNADVNYIPKYFNTSLLEACKFSTDSVDLNLIELLLDAGADANLLNPIYDGTNFGRPIFNLSLPHNISGEKFDHFLIVFKRLLDSTNKEELQKTDENNKNILKNKFERYLHKYSPQEEHTRVAQLTRLIDERIAS